MSYVAIYRKFRPQTFDKVKGQDSIVQTLVNQIKNDRIGHAYLFTGTRGTGKTSVARIFAKAINCLHPVNGEPCNECENCKAISSGSFMDVIEIDAASNTGVDDIRRVIEEVQYTPVAGKYKVYIIDEAHMLTGQASNAFLKTLEEPPAYAVFILATTEPYKLPVTILSRCQRYDFKRISTGEIKDNMLAYLSQEGISAEDKAVTYIARLGDGSMRDALSLLDKAIAFNLGEPLTYENTLSALGTVDTEVFSAVFRSVLSADAGRAVAAVDREVKSGKDISRFVYDFVWYLRNLLLLKESADEDLEILGLSDENLKSLKEDAALAGSEILMRYIRILSELMNQLRFSNAKQVLADIAVIKLARPQMETDMESVLDRIRQLEKGVQTSAPVEREAYPAPQTYIPQEDYIPSEAAYAPQETYIPPEAYAPQEAYMAPEAYIPQESYIPPETYAPQEVFRAPETKAAPPPAAVEPEPVTEPEAQPAAPAAPKGGSGAAVVCANWSGIAQQSISPLLKAYLRDTVAEALDENTIHIQAGSSVAENRLESNKNEIRELIKTLFGCDVNVVVDRKKPAAGIRNETPVISREPSVPETVSQPEEERLETLLKNNIKMNIETEDA